MKTATLTRDRLSALANAVIAEAKDAEWKKLNATVNFSDDMAEVEDALIRMADVLEANIARAINQQPESVREALNATVNEKLARLCGVA